MSTRIHSMRERLKDSLYQFIAHYELDTIVAENALSIPMNIPLGLALTEVITETGIPAVGHHHDFAWERARFAVGSAEDVLSTAYPPVAPNLQHVVINSPAQQQLALRRGVSSTLVPNVMDFDVPARGIDEYNRDLRERLGIAQDEWLILQPTRVVPRKGIEHAIELVASLSHAAVLVISHAAGDEGLNYRHRLERFARALDVRIVWADNLIGDSRDTGRSGNMGNSAAHAGIEGKTATKRYDLSDIYAHADFVTYPSIVEGFGNAFLEAVHARKPLLVNRYPVYESDIRPCGFDVVEIDGMLAADTADAVEELIRSPNRREASVERNLELARTHFSYNTLNRLLAGLM